MALTYRAKIPASLQDAKYLFCPEGTKGMASILQDFDFSMNPANN
jgi:hypothetical protein